MLPTDCFYSKYLKNNDKKNYIQNMRNHKRLWYHYNDQNQFSRISLEKNPNQNQNPNLNSNSNPNQNSNSNPNQNENLNENEKSLKNFSKDLVNFVKDKQLYQKYFKTEKKMSLPRVQKALEKSSDQLTPNGNHFNFHLHQHQQFTHYLLDLRQTYANFRKVSYGSLAKSPFQYLTLFTLLLLSLTVIPSVVAISVGLDPAGANLTDLGSPVVYKKISAPKYQTAYACEGKKLTIECESGQFISLIRANYGRFSITICNDHGNVEWSVNCMFQKTLSVLNSRCANKQSCTVLATTAMFGDPCPGTHKYLEAHYQCVSVMQTSTTTSRPSPPPWVLNQPPPILPNIIGIHNSSFVKPGLIPPPIVPQRLPQPNNSGQNLNQWHRLPSTPEPPTVHTPLIPEARPPNGGMTNTGNKNPIRHEGVPQPPPIQHHHHHTTHHAENTKATAPAVTPDSSPSVVVTSTPPNTRILTGVGGTGTDDGSVLTTKSFQNGRFPTNSQLPTALPTSSDPIPSTEAGLYHHNNNNNNSNTMISRTINNFNPNAVHNDETTMFCGPTKARNLFWNITRVGDSNVQPCPGGAAGIAKWRCVLMKRFTDFEDEEETPTTLRPCLNASNCLNKFNRFRNFEPTWHPLTPDLTQCRSLWLNSLEMRVNQRDSSLISIANDLSEVTSSKTLYGGDMLVTTKIIQTMSEKMFHDKETFPDQRQREAIILELLHGVVKTGSNLLDESQLPSWLDLNQEDQMRVATSLLTGLEYNAFLLADTIIREVNVVQKVKNILLSVRVLETKNIQSNVVFPDAEQWHISNDRIELPKASLMENSEGGLVRIVFAAFDRLESILKPTYDHYDLKSARSYVRNTALSNDTNDDNSSGEQRIRILNSKVISASLGKGRHIQLSQPIKLTFKHLKTENVTNPTCVFWNYIDHAWSANGCNLETTNRTHSLCTCNHLTNFALLMDVVDEHSSSLFGMFDGNMRLLIYISIAICVVFIVVALLTLKIFNGVFTKSARTSIYRNIYICLFVIELLFLFGIEQQDTSIFCGFNTTFLHCAVLAGIAWFCFEAFQSYTTLTTDDLLLEVDQTAKVNCYYLLSYGLSLTIVAISLIIDPNSYTQNDYCVLMEAKVIFYGTFVAPVAVFLMGAIIYTFLSWVVLCRRNRTTLKNKEHSRLANIRFDIRCSFIFLLLFSAVWTSSYFYLRQTKVDDEMAHIYGYMFVGFNSLMGVYIFVFHCIQNEKIRREYRKYVRQNSWLPKCLRCSKTSISSGGVGGSNAGGLGGGNGGAGGTISSNATLTGANTILANKKSKITDEILDGNENEDGCTAAADDAIIPSSDCELNCEPQIQSKRPIMHNSLSQNLKTGILPGSLVIEHSNGNSDSTEGNIILARGSNTPTTTTTGTLRSLNGAGARTPSAGHTSPTSSAGSTHLIFGHGHKQQMGAGGSMGPGLQAEAYYHQPDYYYKQPGAGKAMPPMHLNYYGNTSASPSQQHPSEFFYWTQKQHGKKKRSGGGGNGGNLRPESPSGSLHSRTTASSQQLLFYPSYKKNPLKNQAPQQHPQQYPHYSEAIEPNAYYQTQPHRRYPPHQQPSHKFYTQHHHQQQQQQQQQLSSDEEQMENAAHSRLLHLNRSRSGGGVGVGMGNMMGAPQIPIPPPPSQPYHPPHHGPAPSSSSQRYFRNKQHSSCDVTQDYDGGRSVGGNSDSYYNHGSLGGGDGPVYEEIMSNRSSDIQHYDIGLDLDYNNERDYDLANKDERVFSRNRNFIAGGVGGGVGGGNSQRRNLKMNMNLNQHDDDDEDDEDDDSDEDDDCQAMQDDEDDDDTNVLPQSDERMRRLMAMQDEDFKRRFQRQQRKKAAVAAALANDAGNYHEPYDPHQFNKQAPQPQQPSQIQSQQQQHQQQQQQQHSPKNLTVFGVSGGGVGAEGSVRSFKRSPSGRLAINEIFQIPTLPQNIELKKQQQHQQQQQQQTQQQQSMSPQSTTSSSSSSQQQAIINPQQQQQPRNISAMLDENNTVRCYLEPLTK